MKIVHFDVDEYLDPYLSGEKRERPLQDADKKLNYSKIEAVSIKSLSKIDAKTLAPFQILKLIITRTVGTDHIDLEYCKEKGIAVYHILDYGSFNIAEHTFALMLSGARNIVSSQKEIHKGEFSYAHHLGVSLKGKTLGVVGTGRIGLEVIRRALAFEMNIVAYDVYQNEQARKELGFQYVSLEELAQVSDIITIHAPLLESTKHMINDAVIKEMKDGVILINTARGGLIDTNALIGTIKKFRFVGLDVIEKEDAFSKNHPLLSCDNVVITPHIAFFSDASVKKIAEETERLLKNYEQGNEDGKVR